MLPLQSLCWKLGRLHWANIKVELGEMVLISVKRLQPSTVPGDTFIEVLTYKVDTSNAPQR